MKSTHVEVNGRKNIIRRSNYIYEERICHKIFKISRIEWYLFGNIQMKSGVDDQLKNMCRVEIEDIILLN